MATPLIVMNRDRKVGMVLFCRLTDGLREPGEEKFLGDFWPRPR